MSTTQQQIDDGGQAFPHTHTSSLGISWQTGMSLRDWFAGMALQGLMAKTNVQYATAAIDARAAYETADAMIEARKKDYIIDRGEGR
jgi:hypothetical protein